MSDPENTPLPPSPPEVREVFAGLKEAVRAGRIPCLHCGEVATLPGCWALSPAWRKRLGVPEGRAGALTFGLCAAHAAEPAAGRRARVIDHVSRLVAHEAN